MYVLSLIDTISKTLVKQIPVGEKTNEIPVAQAMLAEQNLNASTIITADAMHTQKKLAQTIVKKTLTTSSPLKTTNQSSEKPLSKTHQKKTGRFRTVLRNLPTGE
jgi:predicted transposase YbfD/YdcC